LAHVESLELPEAPAFPNDPLSQRVNHRHPSYAGWDDWCTAVGLQALFFDREEGLMREHPGTFPLTEDHAIVVEIALDRYHKAHPDAVPRFDRFDPETGRTEVASTEADRNLARLIWLDFWVRWALDNCERPVIHNH
jgi:hypothetical protein